MTVPRLPDLGRRAVELAPLREKPIAQIDKDLETEERFPVAVICRVVDVLTSCY